MQEDMMKQRAELLEMQTLVSSRLGQYFDIGLANAALEICSSYGLDKTARFISYLKKFNITDEHWIIDAYNAMDKTNPKMVKYIDETYICPNCMTTYTTPDGKYCKECGQKLNFKELINTTLDNYEGDINE